MICTGIAVTALLVAKKCMPLSLPCICAKALFSSVRSIVVDKYPANQLRWRFR